jgi:hypothetical protein
VKPRRVVIGGLPYFGRMLAGSLATEGWDTQYLESPGRRPGAWLHTARAIAQADLVYLIGGQIQRGSRPDWLVRLGRPVVMHWVGSDVSFAREVHAKRQVSDGLRRRPVHWVEVPWTGSELTSLGVAAEVVPLTSARLPSTVAPMPSRFTVLTYLPSARPEFYGRATVFRLAERLPGIRFLVAGSSRMRERIPANVEMIGWQQDMEPIYAESTVLIRQPEHDGLSFMVLESLAAGRYVIWNHEIDGVTHAASQDEAFDALTSLLERHERGELGTNELGRAAVARSYSIERIRSDILGRFEAILAGRFGEAIP